MQFKHFLYWGAVCSAVGQMLLALYARYYGEVIEQISAAELMSAHSESAVIQALNYAMPVSVGCLLMLLYTRKYNKVGGVAFCLAVALQGVAVDWNLRAVRHVFGAEVRLETVAWWYPVEKPALGVSGG